MFLFAALVWEQICYDIIFEIEAVVALLIASSVSASDSLSLRRHADVGKMSLADRPHMGDAGVAGDIGNPPDVRS